MKITRNASKQEKTANERRKKMKRLYDVSIELQADKDELIPVRFFHYAVLATSAKSAIDKAFEEIYKDEENYNRDVLTIHLNELDILRA